ncbi:SLATT domain-containing protein [Specibacter cremeus]|uniref:SLATT domain-containing protein n=1 Tax=Specibacter cremeus TaxID=1629051 RepID=UPI000F771FD9
MTVVHFRTHDGRPGIQDWDPLTTLKTLEERSYKNYKRRMFASQRLAARDRAWNTSLLSFTVSTTIASVGMLTAPGLYGPAGPTLLTCLAVLSLVSSLVVSGLDYGARSRNLFSNYRRFQRLSVELEHKNSTNVTITEIETVALLNQFNDLLDECENHTDADHDRAEKNKLSIPIIKSQLLTFFPYATLVFPVLVIIPFALWAMRAQ